MVVFVTGGTGFLGQALIRSLRANGRRVRALVRPDSDTGPLDTESLEIVFGDIRDPVSIQAAMAGCQAVIHAAAHTHPFGRRQDFEQTNVDGFRNVMEAAYRHAIPCVVYVSSYQVLGPSFGELRSEEHMTVERRNPSEHERTKRLAERLAHSYISGGLPLTIVYPTMMYGPGPIRPGNLVSQLLVARSKGKVFSIPAQGENRLSLAYVDDVARGISLALDRGRRGERFILGGESVRVYEFFAQVDYASRRASGLNPKGAGSRIAKWGARLAPKSPPYVRALRELLIDDWAFSSELAQRRLRYKTCTFQEGLARTVEHLGALGKLTR
jgi:farnesol dehydrogenase